MKSWIEVDASSDFSIYNVPFGMGFIPGKGLRVCSRIGEYVIDLESLYASGLLEVPGFNPEVLSEPVLNAFIALGKEVTNPFRRRLQELFEISFEADKELIRASLYPAADIAMSMPLDVGDYTDFYSSIEHATNVGMMFRDPSQALLPNWTHLPVGYHGRASSILVSGAKVHRPWGQIKPAGHEQPVFSTCQQLDFELETACVIGKGNDLGLKVTVDQAEEYIFGMLLFNDLSARDIQSWEYVPLGPFLSKNFASVVSPWVVTLEALEPFRCKAPELRNPVLPYLQSDRESNYDISLEVYLKPAAGDENLICRSNFRYMYWDMKQQLAHHTINGCNLRIADLLGSGTISGPAPGSYGSMLELSWRGTKPLTLSKGEQRKFIEDGDTVIIRGHSQKGDIRVGFGECLVEILPSIA